MLFSVFYGVDPDYTDRLCVSQAGSGSVLKIIKPSCLFSLCSCFGFAFHAVLYQRDTENIV